MAAERIVDAVEETKNEKEGACKSTCNSDCCLPASEPILGCQSHLSITPSFCETDLNDGSKESSYGDSIKNDSLMRRQSLDSGIELQESGASDYKIYRTDSSKTTANYEKMYSRCRSPSWHKQKHQSRRFHFSKKNCIENDGDACPILDAKDYRKAYPRNGSPVGKEKRYHSGRHHSVHAEKTNPEECSSASALPVQPYDNDYSSFDCGRLQERPHDFGYYDREETSYYRERGPSCDCDDERFAYDCPHAVHTQYPCAKTPKSFREDLDFCIRKGWYEVECSPERRARIKFDGNINGDLYHRRGLSHKDLSPPHRESRRFFPRYSYFKEKDKQWREKNDKLQLSKRVNLDSVVYDCKHENGYWQDKYNRSVSFTDRERDIWFETYERNLPVIGRDMKISDRRGRYGDTDCLHSDRIWSMDTEDEYQRPTNSRSLSSWTYRESNNASGGRWHNAIIRNEAYYSRSTKRYHRRENEEDRDDDRFGISIDTDDIDDCVMYNDKHFHSQRRSYRQQSEVLHLMNDESIVRHKHDRLHAEETLFSYKETSKPEMNHAKRQSVQGEMVINNLQLREGHSANCKNRNSNISCRGEHQQMVKKCRDSNTLIVGEGKSSVRCSGGGSMWCNVRLKEKTTLKDFNDSLAGKAGRTCIPKTQGKRNNDKQLEKFLVAGHGEDLDIEEGQIVVEDNSMGDKMEKKNVSETAILNQNVNRRMVHSNSTSNGNKAVDSQRILETLAKMEKRRERFKDPITIKKEPDKTSECQYEAVDDTEERILQRPSRKRRWGAS